jgi:hypothetical protein
MSYRDLPTCPMPLWVGGIILAVALVAATWSTDAEAATVLGEVTLEFEHATVVHAISAELPDTGVPGPLITLWSLGLYLPDLIVHFGPLIDLSWAVHVQPDQQVIPIPGALLLMLSGLAVVAVRPYQSRRRRSDLPRTHPPAAGAAVASSITASNT